MKRSMQIIMMLAFSLFLNNLKAAADNKKTISIKGMGHDVLAFDVSMPYDDTTTIKEIKEYIHNVTDIPVARQILYKVEAIKSPFMIAYMKRWIELKDDQTCANYSIQSHTILRLCLINNISPLNL